MKRIKKLYHGIRHHIEPFSLFVLGLTFLAIAINTLATWQLKVLTAKQITYNIRPIVICDINHSSCRIRNIGNGAALYIKSDLIPVRIPKEKLKYSELPENLFICIEGMPCLEANSRWIDAPIKVFNKDMSEVSTTGRAEEIEYILTFCKDIFRIYYKDINFTDYGTMLQRKKNGFIASEFTF